MIYFFLESTEGQSVDGITSRRCSSVVRFWMETEGKHVLFLAVEI